MNSIFAYLDYREFLRDQLQELKRSRWYSARAFAQRAGFSSPSFMKMVVDGKRNLSAEGAKKISIALKHNKSETRFFELLVKFTQEKSPERRVAILKQIMEFKKFLAIRPLEPFQFEYFSNWKLVALREALSSRYWQQRGLDSISEKLQLSESELHRNLSTLLELKLIEKDKQGCFKATSAPVQTPREMRSLAVRNYHKEMINLATTAIDQYGIEDRDVGALTIGLTAEAYQEVKEKIAILRREINAKYSNVEAKDIYQLNFQLFPLLKAPGD